MAAVVRTLGAAALFLLAGVAAFIVALSVGGNDDTITRTGSYVGVAILGCAAAGAIVLVAPMFSRTRLVLTALGAVGLWLSSGVRTMQRTSPNEAGDGTFAEYVAADGTVSLYGDAMPRLNTFGTSLYFATFVVIVLTPLIVWLLNSVGPRKEPTTTLGQLHVEDA